MFLSISAALAIIVASQWNFLPVAQQQIIIAAIAEDDVARVDAILRSRPLLLNAPIGNRTLLRVAADYGPRGQSLKVATLLRQKGARVDIRAAAALGLDDEIRHIAITDSAALQPKSSRES